MAQASRTARSTNVAAKPSARLSAKDMAWIRTIAATVRVHARRKALL